MDSVQVGKAVFVKVSFASLGIEPRTFSYPGSCATNSLLAKKRGGLLVFILLFRNLKAQNGIFWARIGCFDVYDNDKYEVHSINLVEHLNFGWLW